MTSKQSLLFKVLLNRFQPGVNASFLKSLPPDESQEIMKQTATSQDAEIMLTWPYDLITRVHYSWLVPALQEMPEDLRPSVIASLNPSQAVGLRNMLKIPAQTAEQKPLADPLKKFMCNLLFRRWNPQDAMPGQYLPPTQLSPLLNLDKTQLVEVINFLAIYDLAEAIRHIVDKKYLRAIYLAIDQKQQHFLRLCLHKKEKLAAPGLSIEKWDQKPETLNLLLHRRGLLRLGKTLCGQHPSFVWHIVHTLDTGRAATISLYYRENAIPNVSPLLIQQILSLMNFLTQKTDP